MPTKTDPIRPTDDEARALARRLLDEADHAALGVILDGHPFVTRIALARDADGTPLTLVSDLAMHSAALRETPEASLLIGEPGPKGDPLTHARLTLQVRAEFGQKSPESRARYLAQNPKATLYFDFGDFRLVHLVPTWAFLNGGFGRAYRLTPAEIIG